MTYWAREKNRVSSYPNRSYFCRRHLSLTEESQVRTYLRTNCASKVQNVFLEKKLWSEKFRVFPIQIYWSSNQKNDYYSFWSYSVVRIWYTTLIVVFVKPMKMNTLSNISYHWCYLDNITRRISTSKPVYGTQKFNF